MEKKNCWLMTFKGLNTTGGSESALLRVNSLENFATKLGTLVE